MIGLLTGCSQNWGIVRHYEGLVNCVAVNSYFQMFSGVLNGVLIGILVYWVVPENIRTPTTGGIEILPPPPCIWKFQYALPPPPMRLEIPICSTPPPPCIWKFQYALPPPPPCIRNSRLLYPPSLSEFQRCFRPLQNFLFNLLTLPEIIFSAS